MTNRLAKIMAKVIEEQSGNRPNMDELRREAQTVVLKAKKLGYL
jgi:hypothetical protein